MRLLVLLLALWTTGSELIRADSSCTAKLDLTFVVDASSSICQSPPKYPNGSCGAWQDNIAFINGLIDSFTIGPDDTRVALIIFATGAAIKWKLNSPETADKTDLMKAVQRVRYDGGNTRTDLALNKLVDQVYVLDAGDRPEVQNTVVFFTDGNPTNKAVMPAAIEKVRNAERPIRILGVGIGNEPIEETLKLISSDGKKDSTYFIVNSYDKLESVKLALLASADSTCVEGTAI